MGERYHMNRPRGNLLPTPTPAEKPSECVRYYADKEKLDQGIIEPVTEPEVYIPSENVWQAPRDLPCENVEIIKSRREDYLRHQKEMPSKEDLSANMKKLTNKEIAARYRVSESTVLKWIRVYGLQRRKGAQITEGDIEPEKTTEPNVTSNPYFVPAFELDQEGIPVECQWRKEDAPEVIVNPTPEQLEQFHTDVPQEEQPSVGYTEFGFDLSFAEIWNDVKDDLVVLRAMYIKKAEQDFERRLTDLIKAVSGGDKAC